MSSEDNVRSMTGFGEAATHHRKYQIHCRIQSVNSRKGLDLHMRLPDEVVASEAVIRKEIQKFCSRGRVNVDFHVQIPPRQGGVRLELNHEQLQAYKRQFDRMSRELDFPSSVSLEYLLGLPGVRIEQDATPECVPEKQVLTVLREALRAYDASRFREGGALFHDVDRRLQQCERFLGKLKRRAPGVPKAHAKALRDRLEQAGLPLDLNDERLLKEVALFAERADVSEELTRLEAHLAEMKMMIRRKGPHGRGLEFLVQEIGREINTTGNKANDLQLSRTVLRFKAELEKIREQIQNIE